MKWLLARLAPSVRYRRPARNCPTGEGRLYSFEIFHLCVPRGLLVNEREIATLVARFGMGNQLNGGLLLVPVLEAGA